MYEVDVEKRYALYGVTAVSHKERVIAIAGTTGAANMFDELVGWLKDQVKLTPFSQGGVGEGNVKVMSYFNEAWTALYHEKMYPEVLKLIRENSDYDIWVTGHSLGGALATLTARHVSGDDGGDKERVKLVTFGQPRTGTKGFSDDCERKVPNHYRVFRVDDPIVFIPPRCNGYVWDVYFKDCANNGFSHLPNAIRYWHPMGPNDYQNACDDRELKCTNYLMGGWELLTKRYKAPHQTYFGKHLSDWGSANCKDGGSQRRGGLRERSEENQIQALVLLLARRGFYGPEVQKQAMSIKANKQSMLSVVQRLRNAGIPGF